MYRLTKRIQRLWNDSPTARNLSKVSAGEVLSKVVSVGSALILIRGLSISGYASFVAFSSIANLSAGLVGSGINTALVHFSAEHFSRTGEKPYSLYTSASIVQIAIFVLLALICLLFPSRVALLLVGQSSFVKPLQLGTLYGLGLLLTQLGRSIYQAEERFTLYIGALWLKQGLIFALVASLWLFQVLSFETVAWFTSVLHIVIGIAVLLYGIVCMLLGGGMIALGIVL